MAARDYYELLEVSPSASVGDIHKAYWRKAARCHPDKGGSHEAMVQILEAWKTLSDARKRSRYDLLLPYRPEGWRNRRFIRNTKTNRSRNRSPETMAEFRVIYQQALYSFNQDLYGAGSTAPPMAGSGTRPTNSTRKTLVRQLVSSLLLLLVMLSVVLFTRNYSPVGRYVPLEHRDGYPVLFMDTATGTVYSADRLGRQQQKGML